MSNQDDRDTLIDGIAEYVVDYPRFEETAMEVAELIATLAESHLKQKIRTATLDEVKEAIKSDEDILINRKHTRVLRIIDNLRGK